MTISDLRNYDFRFWRLKISDLEIQIWRFRFADFGNEDLQISEITICGFWRFEIWEIEIVRIQILRFHKWRKLEMRLFVKKWLWVGYLSGFEESLRG